MILSKWSGDFIFNSQYNIKLKSSNVKTYERTRKQVRDALTMIVSTLLCTLSINKIIIIIIVIVVLKFHVAFVAIIHVTTSKFDRSE